MSDVPAALEAVFREQSGRILAGLIRLSGSFERAEEALQEAWTAALRAWPQQGVPDNSAAWITATAQRRLIDALRRERTRREKADALEYEYEAQGARRLPQLEQIEGEFPDDRLRLMFTCCHPALNAEARVALTLRTLGGLTTGEIARAFLIPEPTLAQRLVRAKRKIQAARIPYEVPSAERLPERLSSVRAVLYLIFNEGYAATAGAQLWRGDLCQESIRLVRVLDELLPEDPETLGLLALMLLQHARRRARVQGGQLMTLEEQDRSLWDKGCADVGVKALDRAMAQRRPGPYQLQAAIAALHAQARSYAETDWRQIAALYEGLCRMQPSPVIALNHAVALAMTGKVGEALDRLEAIAQTGSLDGYHLFYAARGDLRRRAGHLLEAAADFAKAKTLTANPLEVAFIERRLNELPLGS